MKEAKQMTRETLTLNKIIQHCTSARYLSVFMLALALGIIAADTRAQTLTTAGIDVSGTALGVAVPQAANIPTIIQELENLQTQSETCAQDGKLFDKNTGLCRLAPVPIVVEFTNAGPTQLRIQRTDGSFAIYNIDGADGVAEVTP